MNDTVIMLGSQRDGEKGAGVALTCTHTAIISANRDTALGGYSPRRAGSTIFPNASISWSCGVAHRTRDCSNLGFELKRKQQIISDKKGCLVLKRP